MSTWLQGQQQSLHAVDDPVGLPGHCAVHSLGASHNGGHGDMATEEPPDEEVHIVIASADDDGDVFTASAATATGDGASASAGGGTPATPPPRQTSLSGIPDDDEPSAAYHLFADSGFDPRAVLKHSADVEIFTRDEILTNPSLRDMVERNVFPCYDPPSGEPQWIDYVLVSHLPVPGPATLTSAGIAEIWERKCGRTPPGFGVSSPTYYLDDAALQRLEHQAIRQAIQRHNFVHELSVVYQLKVAHVLGDTNEAMGDAVTVFTLIHATPTAMLASADRLKWKLELRNDAVRAARSKIILASKGLDSDSEDENDEGGVAETVEDDDEDGTILESLESPDTLKNRCLRMINRLIPFSTGMTAHVSLNDAKLCVFQEFNFQRVYNYELWDEDFDKFISNVASTRFFCASDRSFFVYDSLLSARYMHPQETSGADGNAKRKVGIEDLMNRGRYEAAFPLHLRAGGDKDGVDDGVDVPLLDANGADRIGPSNTELWDSWGSWSTIWSPQPLDKIRAYFGTRIGFYYLFLEYYTVCLFIPSIFGILSLVYGLATFKIDPGTGGERDDVREFCDADITMCGLCSKCEKWKLSDYCTAYEGGYLVDNELSIPFSFVVAIWSTFLVDAWQRVSSTHVLKWHLSEETESGGAQLRPQFKGVPQTDPLSGKTEQVMLTVDYVKRYGASISVMVTAIIIVVAAILGTIVYRIAVKVAVLETAPEGQADIIAVATAAVLNLIVILVLNEAYKAIAIALTDYENHKTRKSWRKWLVIKVFAFQFVNTNAALIYIALIKPLWFEMYGLDKVGSDTIIEQCAAYGCKLELALNLLIIMGGKQIVQSIGETYVPRIIRWFEKFMQRRHDRKVARSHSRAGKAKGVAVPGKLPWENDVRLAKEDDFMLFDDFQELALQFGFCTLYTTALPITPLLALANNIFEIRVDARKILRVYQRAAPRYTTSINVWRVIFRILSFAGVIMTGLVMAITSDMIPKITYQSEHDGSLEGFINATLWYDKKEDCYVRSFYITADSITCTDASEPNCLTTPGFNQVNVNEVTALTYNFWVSRLVFLIIYEHLLYVLKLIVEAVIDDVSPNTARVNSYHESVTERVSRHDDLKNKQKRRSLRKRRSRDSAKSAESAEGGGAESEASTVDVFARHRDFRENVDHAARLYRHHDKHMLVTPSEGAKRAGALTRGMAQISGVVTNVARLSPRRGKGQPASSAAGGSAVAGRSVVTTVDSAPARGSGSHKQVVDVPIFVSTV